MVTSWNNSRELVSALFFLCLSGVKGAITSPPQNTATKVGSQTYLNCSGNNSVPGWKSGEPGKDVVFIELGSSCSVSSNYLSRYRGEGQGSNTCNLIILNPSLQESGIYSCQDLTLTPKYAVLTVLSSSGTPTVSNGSEVVEGDQLTMTCAVEYRTASETLISVPIAPNLNWTTSGISITNAVTAKTNISVTSSITVVATRDGIPSYDCTAQFLPPANKPDSAPNAPSNVYVGGTYQITGIYYGPTTPNISRRTVNVTANSDIVCSFIELTCNSSANPSASYTWTDVITRKVVATNNVLALAEDNRTYQCTVSNKVNSSSATYTTGISQPRQCVPAKTDNIRIYSADANCDNGTNSCSCVNGSHVNLICEVTNAYPLPIITWIDDDGNVLSSTSSFNASSNGNYTCRPSNQINLMTNTTATKSIRVTDCFGTTPSPLTNVIIPVVVVPCWMLLNLIATAVFLIYYNARDPNGKHEHKKMLNYSFSWLKLMLPCINESSDGGCSQCLWVFLFVLMSITVGLIVCPILLVRAKCNFSANDADKLSTSTMPTSASQEMEFKFSHICDTKDEDAARSRGRGTTQDHFRSSEAKIDPLPKSHPQENKERKQKDMSVIPNYTPVNKKKPRVDDQESSAFSVLRNPDNEDFILKAAVPLPPIKALDETAAPNPNAPLYGELNLASQPTSRRPVQLLAKESDQQYAPLKNT